VSSSGEEKGGKKRKRSALFWCGGMQGDWQEHGSRVGSEKRGMADEKEGRRGEKGLFRVKSSAGGGKEKEGEDAVLETISSRIRGKKSARATQRGKEGG